jgi:hypothetical protein
MFRQVAAIDRRHRVVMPVIPHRLLFRFTIPVPHVAPPGRGAADVAWGALPPLPDLGVLDGAKSFAAIRVGWNEAGLAVRAEVSGKKMPIASAVGAATESDGLQVWVDTRNTQTIHRATRFCHHFVFLPGGPKQGGVALQQPIALAKEEARATRAGQLRTSSRPQPGGYALDAWIPAECLYGYDAEANPLLGFYFLVRDAELGDQYLSVGREFPFDHDPSLWATLELVRG